MRQIEYFEIVLNYEKEVEAQYGSNKKVSVYYLVEGDDLEDAQQNLKRELEKIVGSHNVDSITETKFAEVFPYEEQAPEGFKPVKQ